MSRQNPYTQRQIERAIRAAIAAGLRVVGVQADGTVLTQPLDNSSPVGRTPLTPRPGLRDAREKLGVH